ncbi:MULTISPECIES: type II secretion system protein GspD [unclassified Lentimonas]|uniref:type II secretion system protein GspD n=1 Tax=unclassified Lentimonas TaxID=2630993 RepID=UPI001329A2A8|nr:MULTISPECIES: secretin N-terminal domain-containing protein [unclassified Lentimonas]CAA6691621.1 Type IV pilus biogenesis protein PilQ; Competence protein E [Lentimonas sp. CC10]CAA6696283.1 Type IV pilus biogenesis protein PilQ; Competence protein E [Lentimonas sp. CC19]CAA7070842.1 Type IV pilus biogenesis protein PilQ; Competence protein E [Lentimonas sp. CC11]
MKKYHQITLLLFAPVALWAQEYSASDIDLSDAAIVKSDELPSESLVPLAEDADIADAPEGPVFGKIEATRADAEPAVVDATVDEVASVNEVPAVEPVQAYAPETVDIPDATIDGVALDVVEPVIQEEAISELPSGSEVVLQLPGQEVPAGTATMAEEETISVDFPDEDVRTILRNVADLFDLNVVIPDALQGRTSIKLRNITWNQVYEVVLEPLGFTYVEDRNIIRIKSIEDLVTEPVDTRVFILNYAQSSEIQGSIAPLIDPAAGGRIQVDARSNALVITERPSRMNKIQEIIDTLDRVTDQVMIESKFIEVSNGDLTDIGVDWAYLNENEGDLLGGSGVGSGNPGFQPTTTTSVTSPLTSGQVIGGEDTLNDGLANIAAGGASGGLVAVFSSSEFAATLTAIQTENRSKLVSNPTVVVMNNQQAVFQVGEDYPIREFSVNDQTGQLETGELEYRFVGIELDVTPTVNAAGMITLDVHPVVSALGGTVATNVNNSILNDQIFKKRDAKTQVTIKDGYTIALGGLTAETEDDDESKVPFLGDLPYLGQLFRHDTTNQASTNLIIFLTAKTLNPDGSTYADVIDPRQMEVMELTPSQIPGYEVPAAELELINSIEAKRAAEASSEYKARINADLDGTEEEEDAKATWMR